nr:ceramide-1-phosphate transfer protein [Ciona intestinalis]|eukprot:XP_002129818.1 ceramide-1-phosphate transfer protein [Ciona intestinalis]
MAYFLRHWLQVQVKRCFYLICSATQAKYSRICRRRMNKWVAYGVLGTLAVVVLMSSFRCSHSVGTLQPHSVEGESVVEFMSVVREKESELEGKVKMSKSSVECPQTAAFSVMKMSKLFQECATSPKARQVDMDRYLDAWDELIRFLNSMGKAFTFVSSDVVEKVGILRDFRKSSNKEHYETIEKMILFEKENKLVNFKSAPSKTVTAYGCRTLLRLHRALKFLLILIGKLAHNEDEGKVSLMGYNAYHASPMAKYHPWIVQKAVGIAVYMLPDRTTFLKKMCQDLSDEEMAKTMGVCSESMDAVYEFTNALYSKYDLTEIP